MISSKTDKASAERVYGDDAEARTIFFPRPFRDPLRIIPEGKRLLSRRILKRLPLFSRCPHASTFPPIGFRVPAQDPPHDQEADALPGRGGVPAPLLFESDQQGGGAPARVKGEKPGETRKKLSPPRKRVSTGEEESKYEKKRNAFGKEESIKKNRAPAAISLPAPYIQVHRAMKLLHREGTKPTGQRGYQP